MAIKHEVQMIATYSGGAGNRRGRALGAAQVLSRALPRRQRAAEVSSDDPHSDLLNAFTAEREEIRALAERARAAVRERVRELVGQGGVSIEYVSVADPLTLAELDAPADAAVISLAARVGKARLIDNVLLGMDVADLR